MHQPVCLIRLSCQKNMLAMLFWTVVYLPQTLLAMLQMLLGRLEIYPVILALSVVTLRLPRPGQRRRTPHH